MQRVLVVGGGIAGSAAAIGLAQRGVGCVIAGMQDSRDAAGIGIGLHSPPLRAARALGLFEEIVRAGRPQPYLAMTRAGGGLIAEIPQVNVNDPGDPPFVSMSRMALHDVLAGAVRRHGVEVRLGTTADRLRETGDGVRVTLSDGTVDQFDLVVGADGLHSKTRALVLPAAPGRCTPARSSGGWAAAARRASSATRSWSPARTGSGWCRCPVTSSICGCSTAPCPRQRPAH